MPVGSVGEDTYLLQELFHLGGLLLYTPLYVLKGGLAGSASKASLEKPLREGVERIWAFPST